MDEADMEKHAGWKQAADSANSYGSFLWLALSSYDLKGSLTTPLKRHLKAFIAHQKHLKKSTLSPEGKDLFEFLGNLF